jgi:hypothetical protein
MVGNQEYRVRCTLALVCDFHSTSILTGRVALALTFFGRSQESFCHRGKDKFDRDNGEKAMDKFKNLTIGKNATRPRKLVHKNSSICIVGNLLFRQFLDVQLHGKKLNASEDVLGGIRIMRRLNLTLD